MIYFIGGAPRTGKSQLAKRLSKVTGYSWLSTDNLRESLELLDEIPKSSPLLSNWVDWRENDHISKTFSIPAEEIIANQDLESLELNKVIKGFVQSLDYCKRDFILEGVALLPEYFDNDFINKYKIKFVCVGNTDYETFREFSWENRTEGDWLEKADKSIFDNVILYSTKYSEIFRSQSENRGIKYYDISSQAFNNDLDLIVKAVVGDNV